MLHNVNLLAKALQRMQMEQQAPQLATGGGWFQSQPDNPRVASLGRGMNALAQAANEYQKRQELQQMYAAPGVATAQSGP